MEWRPEIASYAVHGKWLPGSKRAQDLYATAEHSDGQPIDHGLCAAVAEGDLEAIDAAIGKGASINDPHKVPPSSPTPCPFPVSPALSLSLSPSLPSSPNFPAHPTRRHPRPLRRV